MDNKLNNIKQEAAKLMLTPQEKTAMKARIFGVPAPAHMNPKQSPYFIFSIQFMQARVLAPLAVVLVVFAGGSTAAAAQGALPGDVLYPIKISVNEAVEVAFATTPVAKAEVSVKQAVRRVEEAEVLASRGELTAETGEKLAANFEVHAEIANELANEVEAEDPAAAENLRTQLGSSLSAHGAILATLTTGGAEGNQQGTGAVAARVLARADAEPIAMAAAGMRSAKSAAPAPNETATMSLMVATDTATDTAADTATGTATDTVANSATSEASGTVTVSLENDMIEDVLVDDAQAEAALRMQRRAQEQVATARAEFNESKKKLAGSSVTQVSGEFASIEKLMALGSTTLATKHYAEAQSDFTEALKRAIKLHVLLSAQANFKQNVITPILQKALEGDTSGLIEARILPAGL